MGLGLFSGISKMDERVDEALIDPVAHAERGAERLNHDTVNERAQRLRERNQAFAERVEAGEPITYDECMALESDGTEIVAWGAAGSVEEGSNEASKEAFQGVPPAAPLAAVKTPRGVDLLRLHRMPPPFDEPRQAYFLQALAETPNIELCAYRTGVRVSQVKKLREEDPAFEEAVQMARMMASGMVEHQAFRLAIHGQRKGVYFQGMRVDEETLYLPDLMGKVLRANDPRYAAKVDVSGSIDHNHNWADMVKAMKQESGQSEN